ncbi:hypothetical protein, partial [Rubneribacter badeniensis]|uniref:hypothetical protein n=1 Tax=Rubneribacter badeniensis TaxID=2070688 RepID=UPI003A95A67F
MSPRLFYAPQRFPSVGPAFPSLTHRNGKGLSFLCQYFTETIDQKAMREVFEGFSASRAAFRACFSPHWGCGQKVGHSGVRIGVRMYPLETRELAVEAVAAGFSLTEAAELAGC